MPRGVYNHYKIRGRTKETDPAVARHSMLMKGKPSWNKDLTKETDERVARNGRATSEGLRKSEYEWPVERKKEYSERMMGHIVSEFTCEAISRAKMGHIVSIETIKKISNAQKGKKHSPAHIQKGIDGRKKAALERGYWHSEETNKKIGDALRGITKEMNPNLAHSEESNEKRGKTLMGHIVTEGTRKRQSLALTGKYVGPLSSNWLGGLSKFPYPFDFNEKLKNLIRERDEFTCQLCGRIQRRFEKNFAVHHIDYVKENLDPKNLITLCNSCNSKVNSGRSSWTKFFQQELKLCVG